MTATVTSITYTPVKGLALGHHEEVDLELTGVRDNRRFYLITNDGRLVNGKMAGALVQVAATADLDGTTLALRFPDGSVVEGSIEPGDGPSSRASTAGPLPDGSSTEPFRQRSPSSRGGSSDSSA